MTLNGMTSTSTFKTSRAITFSTLIVGLSKTKEASRLYLALPITRK